MKHTKEPWYFVDFAGYHELMDAPFYEATPLLNEVDSANAADNANRAVECVNALAGIENPKEFVNAYITAVKLLSEQRKRIAELEEALKDSLKIIHELTTATTLSQKEKLSIEKAKSLLK